MIGNFRRKPKLNLFHLRTNDKAQVQTKSEKRYMEPGTHEQDMVVQGPDKPAKPPRIRAVVGRFGGYGGRYVPETLMAALHELEAAYAAARKDRTFQAEYHRLL